MFSSSVKLTDEQVIEQFAEIIWKVRCGIELEKNNVANPLWWCVREEIKSECRDAAIVALRLDPTADGTYRSSRIREDEDDA